MTITRQTHGPIKLMWKGEQQLHMRKDRPTMLTRKELEEGGFRPKCSGLNSEGERCGLEIGDKMVFRLVEEGIPKVGTVPGDENELTIFTMGPNGGQAYYILDTKSKYLHVDPDCEEVELAVKALAQDEIRAREVEEIDDEDLETTAEWFEAELRRQGTL